MAKRIAVITGGMGGLGETISIKLHAAGYTVVTTTPRVTARRTSGSPT